MKSKEFDCVAMKRQGAERIYEQTKHMTADERLELWQERTRRLRRRQAELQRRLRRQGSDAQ